MLGIGKTRAEWQWSVCGKHPAAKDYIRINADMPFCAAFENWVENGYRLLAGRGSAGAEVHFWRFWARGIKKGNVVCGLCRDSSDSVGRPFPLLVIGSGPLEGGEEHWDGLVDVLERTWEQMEYAVARRFGDVRELAREIVSLKSPVPHPPETQKKSGIDFSGQIGIGAREHVGHLAETRKLKVPLEAGEGRDPSAVAEQWCRALKAQGAGMPQVLFEGGSMRGQFLAIWWRPLIPSDFAVLWSAETAVCSH